MQPIRINGSSSIHQNVASNPQGQFDNSISKYTMDPESSSPRIPMSIKISHWFDMQSPPSSSSFENTKMSIDANMLKSPTFVQKEATPTQDSSPSTPPVKTYSYLLPEQDYFYELKNNSPVTAESMENYFKGVIHAPHSMKMSIISYLINFVSLASTPRSEALAVMEALSSTAGLDFFNARVKQHHNSSDLHSTRTEFRNYMIDLQVALETRRKGNY